MARNSTSWKPGQSGNPKGRPPRAVEERYMHALVQAMPIKKFLKVCRVHAEKAEEGDLATWRTFLERLMGRPTETIDLLATLAGGVTVEVVERIVSADGNSDTTGD